MKSLRVILPIFVIVALFWAFNIFANDVRAQSTVPARANDATLTVDEVMTVLVDVEVELDGETYLISVPATLQVNAQRLLSESRVVSANHKRIGALEWTIDAIEEYPEEYVLSQFSSVTTTSPDNKLVVVESTVINLGKYPFDPIWQTSDRLAYDAVGNLYEAAEYRCENINPGAAVPCVLVFEVPNDVTIEGLDLTVEDRKRLPFETLAE